MTESSFMKIDSISFSYKPEHRILNHVCADVRSGQLVVLLGPNGAGKSTLLNCMTGLLQPQKGTILLKEENLRSLRKIDIARKIAYVPQKTSVSFNFSVLDFVVMGRTPRMNMFSVPDKEDYRLSEEALDRMGILPLKDRPFMELSGGEQQKVSIARAIAQSPELIILDEPTASLDFGSQVRVLKMLKELSAAGYAVLLTTHNPEHPLLLDSEVWIMNKDGYLSSGSCRSMITEEILTGLYDADVRVLDVEGLRKVCITATIDC